MTCVSDDMCGISGSSAEASHLVLTWPGCLVSRQPKSFPIKNSGIYFNVIGRIDVLLVSLLGHSALVVMTNKADVRQ